MTDGARRSALYRGSVMHARRDEHARRAFRYPVYVAAIDLGELAALDRELALFSHRRRNLFALDDRDYEAGALGLPAALSGLIAGNGLPAPHTTRLVTNLKVWGYVFNPVSFWLNYDARGDLSSVIAEVNNTYGGRRRYVLGPAQRIAEPRVADPRSTDPRSTDPRIAEPRSAEPRSAEPRSADPRSADPRSADPHSAEPRSTDPRSADPHIAEPGIADDRGSPARPGRVGFRHVRELFVSPFLHGPAIYDFWFDAPLDGDRLAITMHVARPSGERIFVAGLTGARRPLTDRTLLSAALRYPLMTAQVIGLIHFEALKLRLRGVPYRRPGPDHSPRPTVRVADR